MRLKDGVRLTGIKPEMLIGLIVAESVYNNYNCSLVITSAVDGTHSINSLHYAGYAVDLRTRDLSPETIIELDIALRDALPTDFDLIKEPNHFHLEWQPKKPL